ncbi:MAG: xanthine phosphoribosyltransferase [Eubacterium sp.]|nr:xanthine phosphoribosyltransferase [Eubacterium sp.]
MDLLKQKILNEGEVYEGNILKVDGFLNHRIDCVFLQKIAEEFHRLFENEGVNKVLTIEASGIAIGALVAREFECPLVFAKKSKTKNNDGNVLTSEVESFTHGVTNNVLVSKKYISKDDKILIVDDFLAMGNALKGLIDIVNQGGAQLAGCGIVIEKGYQHGGDMLREQGVKVESLAIVESMNAKTGEIVFRD